MSIQSPFVPHSLSDIKDLARRLGKTDVLKHHEALDQASKLAGFSNYTHARRSLADAQPSARFDLYITAYWRDAKVGKKGRETLLLSLNQPLPELLSPRQLEYGRATSWFKIAAPDHLQYRLLSRSQDAAQSAVVYAARAMQFMDATGLKPLRGRAAAHAYPAKSGANSIPGEDHSTVWLDPISDAAVLVDEPYFNVASRREKDRLSWAKEHRFVIVQSAWPGMWSPPATRLFMATSADYEVALKGLESRLSKCNPPVCVDGWSGISADYRPLFFSPRATESPTKPRPPSDPDVLRRKRGRTVGYHEVFGGSRRRPATSMPIAAHQEAARLLVDLYAATYYRRGARNRIDEVRSDLNEWVMREYDRERLPDSDFQDLYYPGGYSIPSSRKVGASAKAEMLNKLGKVSELLTEYYPPCAPRDALVRRLSAAAKSIGLWAG